MFISHKASDTLPGKLIDLNIQQKSRGHSYPAYFHSILKPTGAFPDLKRSSYIKNILACW